MVPKKVTQLSSSFLCFILGLLLVLQVVEIVVYACDHRLRTDRVDADKRRNCIAYLVNS